MKNKAIISIVLLSLLTTGCTDTYKMRWAKAEQVCYDNNTTAYEFEMITTGIRVYCKNGFIKEFTYDQYKKVIGPEVEKEIDDFWKRD